jgi:hypothetical protein
MSWIKCNSAGTPTVTLSGNANSDGITLAIVHYTASNKNPTLITSDITTNSGTSAAPAATGFSNSHSNELIISTAINGGSATFGSVTGGFTSRLSGSGNYVGDLIESASGNSITWGATIGSTTWAVILAGFQDQASSSTASIAWTS